MRFLVEWIDKITGKLGFVSGLMTFFIMLVVCVDVVGRSFFNHPIPGANEISELLLACLIFFGLAAAQQKKQHYMVEFVLNRLSNRAQAFLIGLSYLLCASVAALLCWYSAEHAISSFQMKESSWGTVEFPIWPARIVVAFGLALFSVQYLIQFVRLCGWVASPAPKHS